tara:strand:+ start:1904 stop:3214 length:1311 start_codon:yes stop_codon:yes gene_type:complete
MKPLNRPMFKNGGPIKEGIMSGMKEPQAINTVGSPLAPKDETGRGGYAIPLIGAGLAAAARFLPAAYRGFRAARAYTPLSQNLGAGKRFLDIFTPRAGLSGKGAAVGKMGPEQLLAGKGAGFRVGSFIRQNPLSVALPGGAFALETGVKGAKGLAEMTPDLLKSYANAIIPFADPFETGKKSVETKEDNTKLKRVDNLTKEKPVGDVDTKSDKLSEDEKKKINEDRINETKQKYYKLMGVDKLNKEATYDSLIDASRIIQEQGGDLKGNIKSGNLQSAIISAISKNLDKSTDLKRQIDAAVLKGEIEKDINKGKLTSFQEQIKFIKENPNDPLAKKLAGATSVADIVAASAAQGKSSTITSGDIASMIDSKGTDVSGTIPDDEYQKWFKSNKNKDEIDFFIEKYSGADDGLYVVNKKAFIKRGNEIAPVSLDSIIG